MRIDPIALAEATQDALERFGEVTACLQYGEGWSCTQAATPEGPPELVGHDHAGREVWVRRYRCVAGHWYHVETPAPEVADRATLRVSTSAS
jgi:hypothetical protein